MDRIKRPRIPRFYDIPLSVANICNISHVFNPATCPLSLINLVMSDEVAVTNGYKESARVETVLPKKLFLSRDRFES